MKLRKRHKWLLVAGAASMVGSRLAEEAITRSWRATSRKDPPEDPLYEDVSWRTALAWAAALGVVVSVTEVLARHGAAVAWKRVTGKRPPEPRRRPRVR